MMSFFPLLLPVKKSSSAGLLDEYHIADRNEGYDNDDEEGGSDYFPSRTFYGAGWESAKDHSWMMRPLLLLGGLICVPMYGYNWVMTLAQLELIGNDKPLSLFKRDKNNNGKLKSPSAEKIQQALDRYEEKDSNNLAFSPNEYLNTK